MDSEELRNNQNSSSVNNYNNESSKIKNNDEHYPFRNMGMGQGINNEYNFKKETELNNLKNEV